MVEWRNGGVAKWRNGRMAEWRNGGMADGMVEWSNGGNGQMAGMARMAEWQKEWQNGKMAEVATYVLFMVHSDTDDDNTLIFYSIDNTPNVICRGTDTLTNLHTNI